VVCYVSRCFPMAADDGKISKRATKGLEELGIELC
jgi:hypothetical protein